MILGILAIRTMGTAHYVIRCVLSATEVLLQIEPPVTLMQYYLQEQVAHVNALITFGPIPT